MEATLIDSMGTDDRVVDAARVSMGRSAAQFTAEQNARLILYLAKNNHWTPFAHCTATLHLSCPFFVARQLMRHTVGIVYNEISRRYVTEDVSVFYPSKFRAKADSVKQGSDENSSIPEAYETLDIAYKAAEAAYNDLLAKGVCPEQARMVLPLGAYTQLYATASLAAWARICKQRLHPHAQSEIRGLAKSISEKLSKVWPLSWAALTN